MKIKDDHLSCRISGNGKTRIRELQSRLLVKSDGDVIERIANFFWEATNPNSRIGDMKVEEAIKLYFTL